MKNIIYLLSVTLLLIMSGCGTPRKAARTPVPAPSTTPDLPRVTLYPKGYEGDMGRSEGPERRENADLMAGVIFSGLECEHVRVKGVNPLPATGRLEVDLDALRNDFVYPYKGKFISDYGMRNGRAHTGIDIKTVPNDTIRAVLPGIVRMSKDYSGYGNIVVIRHPHGFETAYAHCSRNLVSVNDRVEAGTPVGLAGRTGRATTEHLHFEVRVAGEPVDPKKILDIGNEKVRSGMFYAEHHNGVLLAYNEASELDALKEQAAAATTATEAAQARQAANPANSPAATSKPDPAGNTPATVVHTVAKGDTLYAIARKYSTTVKELCRINGIKENAILSLGQKIRVK